MHDWTKVEAGIYHAFHHRWISAISDALNAGLLPPEMYALPEQIAGAFGPNVLALQAHSDAGGVGTVSRVLKPPPRDKNHQPVRDRLLPTEEEPSRDPACDRRSGGRGDRDRFAGEQIEPQRHAGVG